MADQPPKTRSGPGILLGVIAVLIVGIVVVLALYQKPQPPGPAKTTATTPAPTAIQQTPARIAIAPQPDASAAASATSKPTEIPAWENQIDSVIRSNVNETQTAQVLINMLPGLPEDGQVEAANHIVNLLPDSSYDSAKPLLLNPTLPESVLSVFFTDLMNREDATKLRMFEEIAKLPNHPFHEEALGDLQIYVGEDYGTDWQKWSTAVEQYLKSTNTP